MKDILQQLADILNNDSEKIQSFLPVALADIVYSNHTINQPSNTVKSPTQRPHDCDYNNVFKSGSNWQNGACSPESHEEIRKVYNEFGPNFGCGFIVRNTNNLGCLDNDINDPVVAESLRKHIKDVLGLSSLNTVFARDRDRFKWLFSCKDKQNIKIDSDYYHLIGSNVEQKIQELALIDKARCDYKAKKINKEDIPKQIVYAPTIETFFNDDAKFIKIYGCHVTEPKKAKDGNETRERYELDTDNGNDDTLIYEVTAEQINEIFRRLTTDTNFISKSKFDKLLQNEKQKNQSAPVTIHNTELEDQKGDVLTFEQLLDEVRCLSSGCRDTELCDPSGAKLIYKLAGQSLKEIDLSVADTKVYNALLDIYGNDSELISKYNTYKTYQEKFRTEQDNQVHRNGDVWCCVKTLMNGQTKTIYKMQIENRQVSIDVVLYENAKQVTSMLREHLKYDLSSDVHFYDNKKLSEAELLSTLAQKGYLYIEKINKKMLDTFVLINDAREECQTDSLKNYFTEKLAEQKELEDQGQVYLQDISQFIDVTNLQNDDPKDWTFGNQTFKNLTTKQLVFKYILMCVKFFAMNYKSLFDETRVMVPTTYPVFIGKKGIGKTHLSRILSTSDKLFVENLDLRDSNEELYTRFKGKLVAEFGEVDHTISKRDFGSLKQLVRSQGITYRILFTNMPKTIDRRTYFVFTANNPQYIQESDERGLISIDVTRIDRENIIQNLWSAYLHCEECIDENGQPVMFDYVNNFKYLQNTMNELAVISHQNHELDSIFEDEVLNAIAELLSNPYCLGYASQTTKSDKYRVTSTNILTVMKLQNNRKNQQMIADILVRNGYQKKKADRVIFWTNENK